MEMAHPAVFGHDDKLESAFRHGKPKSREYSFGGRRAQKPDGFGGGAGKFGPKPGEGPLRIRGSPPSALFNRSSR